MLLFLSMALSALGYLDQSRARGDEALAAARRLAQPYSLAVALNLALLFNNSVRIGTANIASASDALTGAEELDALVAEHNFRGLQGGGLIHRGWCRAALGQSQEGIALLDEGIAAHRRTGQVFFTPITLSLEADAYRRAGRTVEALAQLSEALEAANAHHERWFEAEIHRLRGELLRDGRTTPLPRHPFAPQSTSPGIRTRNSGSCAPA
jgi:predicted ATPase